MLGTMSRIALVVPVVLSASAVFAQDLKLHVMSYNIKDLPGLGAGAGTDEMMQTTDFGNRHNRAHRRPLVGLASGASFSSER
jgi:hypothetical protein